MQKAAVVTLGCPKNTVEAEYLLGILQNKGFGLTGDVNDADVVIIHTCSFINDARLESEQAIKNITTLKKNKNIKIYVSGCLPQLLGEKTPELFPEIDGFVGTGALEKLPSLIKKNSPGRLLNPGGLNDSPYRILSSPLPSAYLKIAEGCNHRCSFCIIPGLRGNYQSRSIDSLTEEAKVLVSEGIEELIVIAQDTTTYGADLYDRYSLDKLLAGLARIDGLRWIRLMYAYPSSITDELLDVFKEYKNICNYLDIPVQHISKKILSSMRRPLNTGETVERIKNKLPGIVLRTSLITGFPGETEKDADELGEFLKKGYFTYAGVFEYSDQQQADSSKLPGHVSLKDAQSRRIKLENIQYEVFKSKILKFKNKKTEVLVESCTEDGGEYLITGRSSFQAPEIDGNTIIRSAKPVSPGIFVNAVLNGAEGYDIKAVIKI